MAMRSTIKGYFPISSLPGPLRDLMGQLEAEGSPEDVLTRLRQGVLAEIERYRDGEGNIIVDYESDVTTMYDPGTPREWKYDELRTTVDAAGDVEQQVFWGSAYALSEAQRTYKCDRENPRSLP